MKGKLSIYERLQAKREAIINKRFTQNTDELNCGQGWKKDGESQRNTAHSDTELEKGAEEEPFSGLQLASLVRNRAAALQVNYIR